MRLDKIKLGAALKMYIFLYVMVIIFTFFVSIPMLLMIGPNSRGGCLLFAPIPLRNVQYGSVGGCAAVGVLPLIVAVVCFGLIFLQWLHLRRLKKHQKLPEMSSDEFRAMFKKKFWSMIIAHSVVSAIALLVAILHTSGYVTSCNSYYIEIEKTLRTRIDHTPTQNRGQQQIAHEIFADDFTLNRYTVDKQDFLGRNKFEQAITCRSLFTDPKLHFELKQSQGRDPYSAQYFGFWNREENLSDVGNYRTIAFNSNMYLELAFAGSFIVLVILVSMLILMVLKRHHLRAFITDESMWGGSNYGEGSVRSGRSRKASSMAGGRIMSPVDFENFDKMSDYSRVSKASRSSKGTSYKDMGRKKAPSVSGSTSYRNMSSQNGRQSGRDAAPPSQLTVSRLEQVPQVDSGYTVKRLLNPDMNTSMGTALPPHMRNPQDTQSVADMSVLTVTGAVIGPGVNRHPGERPYHSEHGASHHRAPQNRKSTGLMDYFGGGDVEMEPQQDHQQQQHPRGDLPPAEKLSTDESDLM